MKLIPIVFAPHRTGSSMLVGLLGKCGAGTGKHTPCITRDNPAGTFESIKLLSVQKTVYGNIGKVNTKLPEFEDFIQMGREKRDWFHELLQEEIEHCKNDVVAFKSPYAKGLCMAQGIPGLDIRVVLLVRNVEDQAKSLERFVHRKPSVLIKYIHSSRIWLISLLKHMGIKYISVGFDHLIDNPIIQTHRIVDHCGLKYPGDDVVKSFINPDYSIVRKMK